MEAEATGNVGTGRLSRTPDRLSTPSPRTRISPYPHMVRTPARRSPSAEQPAGVRQQLTLVVQPIIKPTIGQRDSSGVTLEDITLRARIKGRAVKTDDGWLLRPVIIEDRAKLMQFRFKHHGVETTKSKEAWDQWVRSTHRQTVHLLVYEYGLTITKAQDLQEFKESCIQPPQTDRLDAAAEVTLLDVISQLQEHWRETFQGAAVVWRMWANHIARNMNSSTWTDLITQASPDYVAPMLNAADSRLKQHLASLDRSAQLALDCAAASIADNAQTQSDVEAIGKRLEDQKNRLQSRKEIIEVFIREIPPSCPPRHR
ncbi:hypothetical protein JG687_00018447 [Phytophthora cactorum]|uniref:Uncharacterized protein n=2 Tax=Phytophthora cactorum TaxID=29920 RepID=A0A329RR43_9STRA|nr:hypothetical protein Pcac1_g15901 [Phytophthora cactorum]KAG2886530.1 hypothetical protein PC115_g20651 [Phytophthora cactorum]KAG3057424.1 hypothetical protein PC122_g21057 [Phytophthora cactorum]KAG3130637.1 hypothetical protein C6341_g23669 [Phytophthora cactorum]KAG6943465.1 hypothetical protein JG687_00018447 [Phytophthora cactorum]